MPDLRFLLNVSRPRFWLYVFGPYLVGLAAGASSRNDFLRLDVLVFGIYFLLPANLLIYGVNDIFDWETDRLNPKKAEYEMLVRPESHRALVFWIILLNLPFVIISLLINPYAFLPLVGFLFFSIFYSAPPVRAKAAPIIDSLFNVLYVFPAAFGYVLLTGSLPAFGAFIGAGLWTAAMHAYSAIPDIDSDNKAGVETIATLLGHGWTHGFCMGCFFAASFITIAYENPTAILGIFYLGLMRFSLSSPKAGVSRIYRVFPYVNAIAGFILFWSIAWPKFFKLT